MSASLKDIEQQARTLSIDERAALAETLLESLHVPLSDIASAWESEIESRVSAFERGEMPAYCAEDVFAEARRLSQ